tara:strand:- start:31 stop:165 length:135 start_codon:yes stop_codon:yes gene_type:complete
MIKEKESKVSEYIKINWRGKDMEEHLIKQGKEWLSKLKESIKTK